jgi:murein L,D-transpeptidase YcbB/YkuD
MRQRTKALAVALLLSTGVVQASVEEYRAIYQQRHEAYRQEMTKAIEQALPRASREVQEIYKAIGYQPVWLDSDGLTHDAEMLQHELEDDFTHGTMQQLKQPYEAVQKREAAFFKAPTREGRVALELALMQLYVDHIHAILKGSDSGLTPLSLLQESLKKGSLVHGFNAVSKERIAKRTPVIDKSEAILGEGITLDAKLTAKLRKGSDEERLKEFYRLLNYQLVWVGKGGYSDYTKALFERIESDRIFDHSGPTYRAYERLKSMPPPKTNEEIIQREFAIAKLYQDFMGYLIYGAIDWKRFDRVLRKHYKHGVWVVHDVLLSPELLLAESIRQGNLQHAFEKVKPHYPGHDRLVEALVKYRKIAEAGGWPKLPKFRDLKPGMSDPVVPLLRKRLKIEGDYVPCKGSDEKSTRYDACLLKAVKRFQKRHGLLAEGYIGKKTRKALAETAMHKAARLRLSIARLKWFKRDTNSYHVIVNIPDFMVTVYKGWKPIQKMRVVTGRKGHETPIFYNKVRRIVHNPYWRILRAS